MSNSGRSRVREDRFYSPPAMRRYNQQQQKQVQQEEQKVQPPRHQEKQQQSESLLSSNISVVTTNLDRFMKHTTPIVTAQHFSKTSMKGWRDQDKYYNPYFILGDLWESLKEWSAYGAGVPLVRPGEESDSDSSRATSSDGSYEPGSVGLRPRVQENVGSIAESFNKLMLRSDPFAGDGIEEGEIRNPPGLLIFEYFERALPYHRAPLADKASHSIAWYPIYRIPVGPSLQNLDASFLTFHSLSTPSRSVDGAHGSSVIEVDDVWRILLPIFGLAVYKFKSSDWTQSGIHGTEKVNSLMQSTENWLRNLNVYHPDFMFFKNHEFWR
ncbi:Protein of unknown function DUF789 [Cynara cardunculus var. scolymus]|uniref:Uncharacterized protein n=1 Tax=Cynara cardunculus var. scolymus TaxID=59895 RepID=A0A103XGB8_CYNCS|nr:Protein of unknown function DUF789 [Cynara cardunculus var. scolymus]